MIVFTNEDDWQVPEPSHIEGLKNLPLVGCTIPIPAYMGGHHCLLKEHSIHCSLGRHALPMTALLGTPLTLLCAHSLQRYGVHGHLSCSTGKAEQRGECRAHSVYATLPSFL